MLFIKPLYYRQSCSACGTPATGLQPVYMIAAKANREETKYLYLCKKCAKDLQSKLKTIR